MVSRGHVGGDRLPLYVCGVLYTCSYERSDRAAAVYVLSNALARLNARTLAAKRGERPHTQ